MAYITPDEVKEIMDGCTLTDDQIDPYILSAHLFVTRTLGTTLGAGTLKDIERWLTAHIISTVRDRNVKREKLGDAEVEYAGTYGEGLKSTPYGQMVLMLDTTGQIALTGKKSASIYAVKSFSDEDI